MLWGMGQRMNGNIRDPGARRFFRSQNQKALSLLLIALLAACCDGPASETGQKIAPPTGGGIYLGAYADLGLVYQLTGEYGSSALEPDLLPEFYGQSLDEMFGRKLAIRTSGWALPFIHDEGLVIEGQPGRLTFDAAGHRRAWEEFGYTATYCLGDQKLPGIFTEVKDGLWDGRIDALARQLAEFPYPVFFEYWVEADTAGIGAEDQADFKAMLVRVHDRVEAIAPQKVTWVAPTVVAWPLPIDGYEPLYRNYYPGDAYVDWHGVSLFCSRETSTDYFPPRQCLESVREQIGDLASKPVMLEQFGLMRTLAGVDKSDAEREAWYRGFLAEVHDFPEIAAILWVQNDYVNWNSALKVAEPAVQAIREEIAAHPGTWLSDVQTAAP